MRRTLLFQVFFFSVFCLTTAAGCAKNKNGSTPTVPDNGPLLDLLRPKYDLYESLAKGKQDASGFILTEECDSLLFSALLGTGRLPVAVENARNDSGTWHRRPLNYEPCYPDHSASSISRDMFLGLFFFIWENKRRELAEQIFDYGEAHSWKMGDGDATRTVLSPGLQATLAEIIARLGGADHKVYRAIPVLFTEGGRGFEAHLDVLHILLRGELFGFISDQNLKVVRSHAGRNARNGFFAYVDAKFSGGDQTKALESLLDEALFPPDRLPTTADHSEAYLWQRELGADWEPAEGDAKEHTGADFYFLASQLLK